MATGRAPSEAGPGHSENASFSECLNLLFRKSGLSVTQLAHRSWLDIGYVSRLLRQSYDPLNPTASPQQCPQKHPSRDAVIRLGLALKLSIEDMDDLLLAAGYAPLIR